MEIVSVSIGRYARGGFNEPPYIPVFRKGLHGGQRPCGRVCFTKGAMGRRFKDVTGGGVGKQVENKRCLVLVDTGKWRRVRGRDIVKDTYFISFIQRYNASKSW